MSEPFRKKLIDVALPLEAINRESIREKSIRHGHPSTLHLWWSRKPLAACRAVLFASIVDDPSTLPDIFPSEEAQETERQRLFRIIEELVKWESSNNEDVLAAARAEIMKATNGTPPVVLDPFCGGGSVPLEAQRLGFNVRASDLNPVAVLITKALIEIPPAFAGRAPVHPELQAKLGHGGSWERAHGLAEDIRAYGAWVRDEAARRIGHLYPPAALPDGVESTVIAWIWARTVECPNPQCGAKMPLASKFMLSTRKGKEAYVEPIVDPGQRVRFEVRFGLPPGHLASVAACGSTYVGANGKKAKATFVCLVCGSGIAKGEYINKEANEGRMGIMPLAVVVAARKGRTFRTFDDVQFRAWKQAEDVLRSVEDQTGLPTEPARGTFASNAQGRVYGFKTFGDYFTARQIVTLTTLVELVSDARARVLEDSGDAAYADAVATYLAFAIDRSTNTLCTIARWTPAREQTVTAFSRQGIQMTWDFPEVNPFAGAAGDFGVSVEGVADAVETLPAAGRGTADQFDATSTVGDAGSAVVITDPPYYDNIGYSDLSDFFYVWLRRSVGAIYPDLFSTLLTPKDQELMATPYRFGGDKDLARHVFEEQLGLAFGRIRDVQDTRYPLAVFYAFKQVEAESDGSGFVSTGWETMLTGLLGAGFTISGTWPIRSELSNRPVASGTNALASSIVLVCRPRAADAPLATRREVVSALRTELPLALRQLQHGSIAPVDLAQCAIGPGMAIFSRYAKVIEADGTTMSIRTALALINEALDEILTQQEGDFDADTRFAIAWFEQYGQAEGQFGEADVLARAKNTAVNGLVEAGIIASGAGTVRLLRRDEFGSGWDPATDSRVTVWEITQHLVRSLDHGGESTAAALVRRVGGLSETARELAYRLYMVCDRKGWAHEALGYNALVVAWPEIVRLASEQQAGSAQQTLGL